VLPGRPWRQGRPWRPDDYSACGDQGDRGDTYDCGVGAALATCAIVATWATCETRAAWASQASLSSCALVRKVRSG
jgi:hypothetical protein